MRNNGTEEMNYDTYGHDFANNNIVKNYSSELHMENHSYDRSEMVASDGMRICFEFPQNVENDDEILQEVRAILSGELRDCLEKCVG